jgi:hypothetical protein
MPVWLRVVLVVALAVLLWLLVVDLAKDVKQGSDALDPAARAARLA